MPRLTPQIFYFKQYLSTSEIFLQQVRKRVLFCKSFILIKLHKSTCMHNRRCICVMNKVTIQLQLHVVDKRCFLFVGGFFLGGGADGGRVKCFWPAGRAPRPRKNKF